MPRRDAPPVTRGVVLRGVGFGLAIALAAVAVWLIVTSTTQKRIEIGVLTGLWGLLLGAYSMFGSRRLLHLGHDEAGDHVVEAGGSDLAVRSAGTLERADEAAERRAHEARLEQMLRREINLTMTREVGDLRTEIAQLRQDLLEKVGGQLRLERIETTRLIGSDLEALQHEVRQLKVASESALPDLLERFSEHTQVTSVRQVVDPARAPAPVAADPSPSLRPAPIRPAQPAVHRPVPPLSVAAESPPTCEPTPPPSSEDPFASLPRIRPFTDFALEPSEMPAAKGATHSGPDETDYAGRRRRGNETEPAEPGAEDSGERGNAATPPRRRHRRAEETESGEELLARLLAREGARH